ncbi:MAG: sulfurtransferase [Anaerolineales bacterium]|jgi:thiosulfate/3-mercaptopyruvate sulfurtransferase
MKFNALISLEDLHTNLEDPDWVIVDCRFDLDDTDKGRELYLESHIPGAVYAHLDNDLSSPVIPGKTGRHPLPDDDTITCTLSNWGIDGSVQVIAYDGRGGAFAARLWWLLRWLGHSAVAVLDGSFSHWVESTYPTTAGLETNPPRSFTPHLRTELMVDADRVLAISKDPAFHLIDSRANERYHGINEIRDPVAGHIPGAVSAFHGDNLDEDGHFKSKTDIQARFDKILAGLSSENAVFYCGSGVTAAHNLLALYHAGLGEALLYPGSWSEWITDPSRPVET